MRLLIHIIIKGYTTIEGRHTFGVVFPIPNFTFIVVIASVPFLHNINGSFYVFVCLLPQYKTGVHASTVSAYGITVFFCSICSPHS